MITIGPTRWFVRASRTPERGGWTRYELSLVPEAQRYRVLKVEYDGTPRFEKIEGTDMRYATNTADSVIRVEDGYYCCRQAVWYVSDSPTGPWQVCDSVPGEIYTIPPDSPLYYVTHVHVYGATPEVVYEGYQPGYLGTCVAPEEVEHHAFVGLAQPTDESRADEPRTAGHKDAHRVTHA